MENWGMYAAMHIIVGYFFLHPYNFLPAPYILWNTKIILNNFGWFWNRDSVNKSVSGIRFCVSRIENLEDKKSLWNILSETHFFNFWNGKSGIHRMCFGK